MKRQGKILRVKSGYNPNSSSVGSIIPLFIYLFGIAGSATIFITNLFQGTDRVIRQKRKGLTPVRADKKE
ncbi:MAG TPA: hypothetical protein PKG48_00090 [Bacteroidales bacterium]|nr:hypothetical protein [Bacteroidales bacterium]HPS62262.1 hypothetical protein [Bacteroidales bacterium]